MRFITAHLIAFIFLLVDVNVSYAQLTANAGSNQTVCPDTPVQIGSTGATGGKPPYLYSWRPSTGLDNPAVPAPKAYPATTTTYMLIVTDDTLATDTAYVTITPNRIHNVSAGADTNLCEAKSLILGGSKNPDDGSVVYAWTPTVGLSDPTSPHPIANPQNSITYSLTATTTGCPPKIQLITITVIPTPIIDAGNDITIKEGETITLHATGGTIYHWEPEDSVKYPHTPDPDVSPTDTTVYYVYASDPTNTCFGVDSVTVFVEKSDEIIIYNTFTPNGDGNNDFWYIANIIKYPNCRLEVFNRNGRLVYKTKGYLNTWAGKASGQELPAGTYYYLLDLADGKRTYHGTVSIVR